MLILSKTMWEEFQIIKIHCSNVWNNNDTFILIDCVLKEIKALLTEAQEKNKPAILICDLNKGEFPPTKNIMQIVHFFISIQNVLQTGLNFTIFYTKSDLQKLWINRILSVYTPIRPTHIINNKKELKKLIKIKT
jgi:hypothetical protein